MRIRTNYSQMKIKCMFSYGSGYSGNDHNTLVGKHAFDFHLRIIVRIRIHSNRTQLCFWHILPNPVQIKLVLNPYSLIVEHQTATPSSISLKHEAGKSSVANLIWMYSSRAHIVWNRVGGSPCCFQPFWIFYNYWIWNSRDHVWHQMRLPLSCKDDLQSQLLGGQRLPDLHTGGWGELPD